jgi:hypothetical protein
VQEELAKVIQARVGLDEATALQVAATAIEFLKTKLPPQLAPLLEGGSPDVSDVGGLLGGLFGQRGQ